MHLYRFHFLDASGVVSGRRSLRLPTDAAAVKAGDRMLAGGSGEALEIWHLNHLVHSGRRAKIAVAR